MLFDNEQVHQDLTIENSKSSTCTVGENTNDDWKEIIYEVQVQHELSAPR